MLCVKPTLTPAGAALNRKLGPQASSNTQPQDLPPRSLLTSTANPEPVPSTSSASATKAPETAPEAQPQQAPFQVTRKLHQQYIMLPQQQYVSQQQPVVQYITPAGQGQQYVVQQQPQATQYIDPQQDVSQGQGYQGESQDASANKDSSQDAFSGQQMQAPQKQYQATGQFASRLSSKWALCDAGDLFVCCKSVVSTWALP